MKTISIMNGKINQAANDTVATSVLFMRNSNSFIFSPKKNAIDLYFTVKNASAMVINVHVNICLNTYFLKLATFPAGILNAWYIRNN